MPRKRGRTNYYDRPEWSRSRQGCWSLSFSRYGRTIRITQREPGGIFYQIVTDGSRRVWTSLGTRQRSVAKRKVEAFLESPDFGVPQLPERQSATGSPLDETEEQEPPKLTVRELWTRFTREAPAFRRLSAHTRADYTSRAKLIVLALGDKPVEHLTEHDLELYIELRERGTGWPDGRMTFRPTSRRTVQADLKLLLRLIRWGMTIRRPDGRWLVQDNPVRGYRVPREKNPRRPVATYDRFVKTLEAIDRLEAMADRESERDRWRRLRVSLSLAESTGRRRGAISKLRWEDIDWEGGRTLWRAQHDKEGKERLIPVTATVLQLLRELWEHEGRPSAGWVFPTMDGTQSYPVDMMDDDLREAEEAAGLEPLVGSLWHAYRRKWMVERKDLPLKDVMEAGGWSDVQTVMTCYQHADDETLRRVIENPVKLVVRDGGLSGLRRGPETS